MQKINKQQFAEVEYCINKYYNENLAPILSSSKRNLEEKQQQELERGLKNTSIASSASEASSAGAVFTDVNNYIRVRQTGKWNSKTMDDLLSMTEKKILNNSKLKSDITTLVVAVRSTLIGELGLEKYSEFSKNCQCKDLATDYVVNRLRQNMLQQLAKERIPKSTMEYVLFKGIKETFLGAMESFNYPHSDADEQVENMAEQLYKPSNSEKLSAEGLSLIMDGISMGGMGSISATAKTIGVVATADIVGSLVDSHEKTYFQKFSEYVFGDGSLLDDIHVSSRKVHPASSKVISIVNDSLNKKMKVPKYSPAFSPSAVSSISKKVSLVVGNSGTDLLRSVRETFGKNSISVNDKSSVPQWMMKKSKSENIRLATYFLSTAIEMKEIGRNSIKIQGKQYTFAEIAQRSYDYARAASVQENAHQVPSNQTVMENSQPHEGTQPKNKQQYSPQSQAAMNYDIPTTATVQDQQFQPVSGWNSLMDSLGMADFGSIGKNLGYVLATLPELLVSIFTGQSKLKFKDNLFPIAAIVGGLFFKNPFLRLLLLGLGGANLLNKAGHAVLGQPQSPSQPVHQYKKYSNETLDSRLKDVGMKGNTLFATVDGLPCIFTLSDVASDAYYKGALPLNTLANAVLTKYDEQQQQVKQNFENGYSESVGREQNIGIK